MSCRTPLSIVVQDWESSAWLGSSGFLCSRHCLKSSHGEEGDTAGENTGWGLDPRMASGLESRVSLTQLLLSLVVCLFSNTELRKKF